MYASFIVRDRASKLLEEEVENDEEWDPDKHEKRMQRLYGEDFYQV